MTRTERLLNLIQILRTYRYPVSGARLAERLDVSIRTVYRDIATLQAQGAEIEGEPGLGYVLKPGFFIPPLMFTQNEIEALLLGSRWVSQFADAPLSQAAEAALAKITDVLPPASKSSLNSYSLRVGPPLTKSLMKEDLSALREAIRRQRKLRLSYKDRSSKIVQRTVWPFTIGYFNDGRILVAWSEEEADFRHFATYRISSMEVIEERYPKNKDELFQKWQAIQLRKEAKGPS